MYPYFLAKANMLCSSMSLVEEDLTSSLNSTATTENYNDNKTVSKVEISYLELSSEMKFCYNNEILFKISSCCKNWGIVQLGECEMTCWKTILWAILFWRHSKGSPQSHDFKFVFIVQVSHEKAFISDIYYQVRSLQYTQKRLR